MRSIRNILEERFGNLNFLRKLCVAGRLFAMLIWDGVPQRGFGDPAEKALRVEFAHGVKRRCWQTLVHIW